MKNFNSHKLSYKILVYLKKFLTEYDATYNYLAGYQYCRFIGRPVLVSINTPIMFSYGWVTYICHELLDRNSLVKWKVNAGPSLPKTAVAQIHYTTCWARVILSAKTDSFTPSFHEGLTVPNLTLGQRKQLPSIGACFRLLSSACRRDWTCYLCGRLL